MPDKPRLILPNVLEIALFAKATLKRSGEPYDSQAVKRHHAIRRKTRPDVVPMMIWVRVSENQKYMKEQAARKVSIL